MVYFCADDYALNGISSMRIKRCVEAGALNKVSVFLNFEKPNLTELLNDKIKISLHLNLVEGKCMANPNELDLLVDKNGNFKHTFCGLLKLGIFGGKRFKEQLYKEIKTQVLCFKSLLPENQSLLLDSHQHTHMIPAVFAALLKVLRDEKIKVEYLRIPAEPLTPFIKTPSLYFTYNVVNIIKQWLLKFLWIIDKGKLKDFNLPTSYFLGILFSGKMDEKRVSKILPKYIKLAKKNGKDIEVLFHPGYLDENEIDFENIVFKDFYISKNRKTEFDSVIKLSERSVM